MDQSVSRMNAAWPLPDGQRWVPFDPMHSFIRVLESGSAVLVGVDTLPFWFNRGLVNHIRKTGHVMTVWTMGEPTTTDWEARGEEYLKQRFPEACEVIFESSQAEADALLQEIKV